MQGTPAAAPTGAAAGEGDLCYRWKEGQQYCYRVSCKAEIGDMLLEATGTNTYTVSRAPGMGPFAGGAEVGRGSGTAFVVSADGYLITCDHVVRNATDIKVTLGNQTTPCQVVAQDRAHDLALLRVARRGLPAIPLADSEAVELAEEVRAVGFPLSDVLGSSVKITQGSVAGVVARRRGKVFQIDAVVNPGNSGGPLLDGRGAVIGVVNAQLVGLQISKVGFAVPVNYAKTLLTQHRVAFQTAAGPKLDGPALAKRVTPSVALVTMTCHGDDSSAQDRLSLTYHGILDRRKQPKATAATALAPPAIDSSDRDDGTLIVDEYGEISHFNGHVNLPCLLGPLGVVVIDPLPANEEKTWQRHELLTITTWRGGSSDFLAGLRPPGFHGPRFGPPRFPFGGPFGEPEAAESHYPAMQQATYSAGDPKDGTLVIHKRLELKTLARTAAGPKIEFTGQGDTIFDLKLGLVQKVTFSGKLTCREGDLPEQIPVTLACERTTGTAPPPIASAPAVTAPPVAPPESAESAKARLDAMLADLRAVDKDWSKCFQALQGLSMMKPMESRREEVAGVLDNYLTEKNYSARSSALRVARTWGTRRNVPALVGLLDPSESDTIRRRAMEVLGTLGDERAAAAIAQRLKDPSDRAAAIRALQALGAAAEDGIITLLADQDSDVRREACRLLGEIGGAKSIAALKEQVAKGDAAMGSAAKAALDKLQKSQ